MIKILWKHTNWLTPIVDLFDLNVWDLMFVQKRIKNIIADETIL